METPWTPVEDLKPSPVQVAWKKSYAREAWILLHWPRVAFIYAFLAIGALLAPAVRVDVLLWMVAGIFFGVQLCAYRLDQLKGHHVGATIPDAHHQFVALLGFSVGLVCLGQAVALTSPWLLVWLSVGILGVVGYNFEVGGKVVHNMMTFGFTWGFAPIVATYTFMAVDVPSVAALAFGAFAWIFAALHLWSYGQTKCRQSAVCDDHRRDAGTTVCHGQVCALRLTMPKAVNRLAWTLVRLQLHLVLALTAAVAAWRYLG